MEEGRISGQAAGGSSSKTNDKRDLSRQEHAKVTCRRRGPAADWNPGRHFAANGRRLLAVRVEFCCTSGADAATDSAAIF